MGKALAVWRKCADCGGKALENKELRKWEEALPRLKECELENVSRLYIQGKDRSGMRRLPPKSSPGFDKKRGRNSGVLEEGGTKWKVAATSLHNDVFLDTEECHERVADCAYVNVDTLMESFEGTRCGEMAAEVSC